MARQVLAPRMRDVLRAAYRIRAALLGRHVAHDVGQVYCDGVDGLETYWRHYAKAVQRGWYAAAAHYFWRFLSAVDFCRHTGPDSVPMEVPTVRQLYDDLLALYSEPLFTEVTVTPSMEAAHARAKPFGVSVTTHDIVLEGTYFGRFEIFLADVFNVLAPIVRVVALEPQYCPTSPDTSHPHVYRGVLCLGDGLPIVAAALRSGRIYDYFLIVARILGTYSEAAAYHPIRRWKSAGLDVEEVCHACGFSDDPSELCQCDRCGAWVCTFCIDDEMSGNVCIDCASVLSS